VKQGTQNISQLSIEEKVGQLFFIGIPGPTLDSETKEFLDRVKPGGVCLFARNIKSREQTRELLDSVVELLDVPPFLSIDQEGGLVDRLRRIMGPAPAAAKFSSLEDVREFAEITAESLRILGFNMDFAPVVDVTTEERDVADNGMYSRGFGRSSRDVIEFAGTFLETLHLNDVIGCLKHFPGLGAARADSHEELPQILIADDEMRSTDLKPYEALLSRDVKMVMIAHAAYPNSKLQQEDQNGRLLPSSLSSNFVTNLLRDDLKFDGVAITDDLEMGAIIRNYGIGEASKMAFNAGNDMLAICNKPEAIHDGFASVADALRNSEINEVQLDRSVERIFELKKQLRSPASFDNDRIEQLTLQLTELAARVN
jgi:beta-N-acetylhexosaminidase